MTNPTPANRPTAVTVSFIAWLVATALGLATVVLLFVSAGATQAVEGDSATSNFFGITYIFAALLVLILTAVQAVVLFRMRAGRNWARVLLTVLAVLQIVNAVFSLGLNAVVSILGIVILIVATVTMWLPSANVYFGRQKTVTP